jgi:mannose/fructose/N-acetylgalactosamine-specific phosphotransferase system component IIC
MISLSALGGLIILGALLNLDKQVFGQFMVSRPLVTGLIMGLATGEVGFGIWMGLSAELLWMATLPLGGQITPNAGLAASAAFIAWEISGFSPSPGPTNGPIQATLVISFLTVPFWAKYLSLIDQLTRRLVLPPLARIKADLASGRDPRFFRRNFYGLLVSLFFSLLALAAVVCVNANLLRLVVQLAPQIVLLNLGFLFTLIPFTGLVGMAVFLETKTFPFYLGGLLASLMALSAVL